jgi:hypothetical protein
VTASGAGRYDQEQALHVARSGVAQRIAGALDFEVLGAEGADAVSGRRRARAAGQHDGFVIAAVAQVDLRGIWRRQGRRVERSRGDGALDAWKAFSWYFSLPAISSSVVAVFMPEMASNVRTTSSTMPTMSAAPCCVWKGRGFVRVMSAYS